MAAMLVLAVIRGFPSVILSEAKDLIVENLVLAPDKLTPNLILVFEIALSLRSSQ
jgi:hypothetical protein